MADEEHSKKSKKPSGALNVERRTWDIEHFQEVAKERLEKEASGESEKKKPGFVRKREEFQSAEQGAAGPEGSKRAYLKHREADLGLEDKVGKIQVVTGSSAPHQQGGYWCDICQCLLKDSMAYLDHINGKKHQKALGFSMRVERVGVDRVKERLGALKRREEERRNAGPRESAIKIYERKLEEEGAVKEQWKEARKEARRKITQRAAEDDGEGGQEEDDEMAAMMGFGGFGGK
ncbi:c2h2 and c2hc zinc fingers superfamily protein [Nannochloropsis oceanica]